MFIERTNDDSLLVIQNGVIDPIEERERLARDAESGYQGIDVTKVPGAPELPEGEDDEADQ